MAAGRAVRELACGRRAHVRAAHDLRRAVAGAEPELVSSFAHPRRRSRNAVEGKLDLVPTPGRCLRQGAGALHPARETDEQPRVILGLAPVQVTELRDDSLDMTAGARLYKVEPVHADVGRGAREAAARRVEAPVVVRSKKQPILQVRTTRQM